MKNYKDVVMSFFTKEAIEFPTSHHKQGYELAKKYFETRFKNTLRQYNGDTERAFDLYMTKKSLFLFHIYVEELYLLSQEEIHEEHLLTRKMLRHIHNILQDIVNAFDEVNFDRSDQTE